MKEGLEGWKDTPSLFCSAQCLSLAISKSNRLRLSKGIEIVALKPNDKLLVAFCPVLVGTLYKTDPGFIKLPSSSAVIS